MLELLKPYLIEVLVAIFGVIATYIGNQIKKKYEEKVNSDEKRKVVEYVVNAVEQVWCKLNSTEKLNKAKEYIIGMLNEKGIKITELELDIMIESVVNGFNVGKNKDFGVVKNEIRA